MLHNTYTRCMSGDTTAALDNMTISFWSAHKALNIITPHGLLQRASCCTHKSSCMPTTDKHSLNQKSSPSTICSISCLISKSLSDFWAFAEGSLQHRASEISLRLRHLEQRSVLMEYCPTDMRKRFHKAAASNQSVPTHGREGCNRMRTQAADIVQRDIYMCGC